MKNKDLLIVVRAPMEYISIYVALDKDIHTCVTQVTNNETIEDVDLFSIKYEFPI